jgi:hypothetical protein
LSNVKNYKEQGGERWVIGGTLEMSDGTHLLIGETNLKLLLDGQAYCRKTAVQADSTAATIAELKQTLTLCLPGCKLPV